MYPANRRIASSSGSTKLNGTDSSNGFKISSILDPIRKLWSRSSDSGRDVESQLTAPNIRSSTSVVCSAPQSRIGSVAHSDINIQRRQRPQVTTSSQKPLPSSTRKSRSEVSTSPNAGGKMTSSPTLSLSAMQHVNNHGRKKVNPAVSSPSSNGGGISQNMGKIMKKDAPSSSVMSKPTAVVSTVYSPRGDKLISTQSTSTQILYSPQSKVTTMEVNPITNQVPPFATTTTGSNGRLCCDKCDGNHETDQCPYYKKKREDHPDAQKHSNKQIGGTSLLPGSHFGLHEARVIRQPGDGSCLFHSMSYGLGQGYNATRLRSEICTFLSHNPNLLISETPLKDWVKWDTGTGVSDYIKKMSRGSWGGGIEMACLSQMKQVNVHVYERVNTGYKRISAFDCFPDAKSRPIIRVLYCGGVHYDALIV